MNTDTNSSPAVTLEAIAENATRLEAVSKAELNFGDYVRITTRNSTYVVQVEGEDLYSISGGWVDRQGLSPMKTTIAGCSWGGSTLKADIVAACGLHLEFGKRIVTSTIQRVAAVRHTSNQVVH